MTRILIAAPRKDTSQIGADVVVIVGNYGPTPVRAMVSAWIEFNIPVVLIAGMTEIEGGNLDRRFAEGHRKSCRGHRVQFLEQRAEVIAGIRFIGSHHASLEFILSALSKPHDGPTVIVTYEAPPEDISAVALTGKVASWIHAGTTRSEPLVVEV